MMVSSLSFRSGNQARNCWTTPLIFAWVSMAPLLTPVVPPV